jgi:hypothetical protein
MTYCPYSIDEKIDFQRGQATCSMSHSRHWQCWDLDISLGWAVLLFCFLSCASVKMQCWVQRSSETPFQPSLNREGN